MRSIVTFLFIFCSIQTSIAALQFNLPSFARFLQRQDTPSQQEPMEILKDIFPGSSDKKKENADGLSVSDVLGKEGKINIFAGFTRDIDSISKRLDNNTQDTTVLAPLNSAITKLPRKPWEDPKDYDTYGAEAYDGSGGDDRAYKNLEKFVQAHVVPVSGWEEGKKVETLAGNTIWWENNEGTRVIQPGGVQVSSVADKVSHGEVWILKGCLNYT